jgi:hypothetical protein
MIHHLYSDNIIYIFIIYLHWIFYPRWDFTIPMWSVFFAFLSCDIGLSAIPVSSRLWALPGFVSLSALPITPLRFLLICICIFINIGLRFPLYFQGKCNFLWKEHIRDKLHLKRWLNRQLSSPFWKKGNNTIARLVLLFSFWSFSSFLFYYGMLGLQFIFRYIAFDSECSNSDYW